MPEWLDWPSQILLWDIVSIRFIRRPGLEEPHQRLQPLFWVGFFSRPSIIYLHSRMSFLGHRLTVPFRQGQCSLHAWSIEVAGQSWPRWNEHALGKGLGDCQYLQVRLGMATLGFFGVLCWTSRANSSGVGFFRDRLQDVALKRLTPALYEDGDGFFGWGAVIDGDGWFPKTRVPPSTHHLPNIFGWLHGFQHVSSQDQTWKRKSETILRIGWTFQPRMARSPTNNLDGTFGAEEYVL